MVECNSKMEIKSNQDACMSHFDHFYNVDYKIQRVLSAILRQLSLIVLLILRC